MLVYGDHEETLDTAEALSTLREDAGRWLDHDALRDRFIMLSGLAQGVADADFAEHGSDRERAAERTLLQQLVTLGSLLLQSWDEGCSGGIAPALPVVSGLPAAVRVREGEGYAHYALYPEAYGLAARQLKLAAPPIVIGLRSIGSGLAAIAAAALEAPTPVTLRPGGEPFARSLRIDASLAEHLLQGERHFVIVDEGPGLSGSSFGCVADWLEDHDVPAERIAFLAGHGGDLGPQASPRHRERWQTAQRPVVQPERLPGWISTLVGTITNWSELSGGAWRPLWNACEATWPPIVPAWERMKFLVETGSGQWLVRFAGLGSAGRQKFALATLLAEHGFGPEVAGLTHGWLVLRWHSDAMQARPSVSEVQAYLALRSRLPGPTGASLSDLVTMVRRNLPEFAGWNPDLCRLAPEPVQVDGRLHAHEWLRLPCGRLLKADALDHHRSHDLVGCQDIAWDLAGAEVELGLTLPSAKPNLEALYRVAYCAFQIGAHTLGKGMSPAAEHYRLDAAIARYRLALVDAVENLRDVDQALGRGIEAFA
ncbi:hypothetical protein [Sphingomonas sp. LHG3443-2]|uniref:hypothetical protein n=1 Tax=Sphingomonas sp. LHG3443-2 TaxID=2804639 RepID=UPI003CF97AE9